MPIEFVPFLKDTPTGGAQASAAADQFRPLLPPARPASTPEPTRAAEAPGASNAPAEPMLTVQRTGERITQIQIRCTCGQVIELDCDY